MKVWKSKNQLFLRVIYVISIAVPLLVVFLIFSPVKLALEAEWIKNLPMFHAILNSSTTILLVLAFVAIRKKQIVWHRNLMLSGLVLGAIFLISYVIYHSTADSTVYGDLNHNGVLDPNEAEQVGNWRTFYLLVLLSHIGLSIVVVPFVLMAFYFALTDQIPRHKKLVKFTYPIWLYVSITGVLVYLLIRPYYF